MFAVGWQQSNSRCVEALHKLVKEIPGQGKYFVEVHDPDELAKAIDAGAGIIGVNNRNLRTLEVDVEASARLIARIPGGVVAVSESGLRTVEDLVRLRSLGYRAFLVGERFMSERDPGMALRELLRGASSASARVAADFGRPDRSC